MLWEIVRDEHNKPSVRVLHIRPNALRVDPRPPKQSYLPYWVRAYNDQPTEFWVLTDGARWRRVYRRDPNAPRPPGTGNEDVLYIVQNNRRIVVRLDNANRYTVENVGRFE